MSGILDFPDGTTWVIPERWSFLPSERPGTCRSCGARVLWLQSPAGKRAPVNPDGVNHFATCPHADQWRRR